MSSDLTKHITSSSGLKVITVIFSIMQGIIIARYLLPEGRGEIAVYMVTFNMMFSLLSLGVRQSSSYYLAKENISLPEVTAVHLLVLIVLTLLGSIMLIIAFLLQGYADDHLTVGAILILLPLRLYINHTNSIAFSRRWINKVNASQLFLVSMDLFGVILFIVMMDKGVQYYFVALVLSSLVTSSYVFWWATRLDDYMPIFSNIVFNTKKIIGKGITYALPLFIFGLNYSLDVLLLQFYVSVDQVGVYTLGVSLSTLLWHVPAVFGPIIFSYGISTEDSSAFSDRLWKNTWRLMLYLLPLLMLLTLVLPYLIPFVYGGAFTDAYTVFMLLLPGTYAMIAFKMLNSGLASQGDPSAGLYIFSGGAILNVVLNIILIPELGINGAALASMISYTSSTTAFVLKYRSIVSNGR